MIDTDLLLAKASSIKRYLDRIKQKRATDLETFIEDIDGQEIILFNLQMAIQNCMDMASHVISQESLGVVGSYNEMFYILEEKGFINKDLTEKMVKSVGFRNLMVHEYTKIDLNQVFEIADTGPRDILVFLKQILTNTGVTLS